MKIRILERKLHRLRELENFVSAKNYPNMKLRIENSALDFVLSKEETTAIWPIIKEWLMREIKTLRKELT